MYFVDTKEVPIDFSAPATWAQMDEAAALTVADPWVIDNSIDLWIDSLRAFSADQGSPLTQVPSQPLCRACRSVMARLNAKSHADCSTAARTSQRINPSFFGILLQNCCHVAAGM